LTCVGFSIISPDRALLWADAETYAQKAVSGTRSKITINVLAGLIATGTGRVSTLIEGAEEISHRLSFEDALQRLPVALRQATRNPAALALAARSPMPFQVYAVVGFHHGYRRLVGATFDSRVDFEADLTLQFSAPFAPDLVEDAESAIAAATAQMVEIKRDTPAATGGTLCIAELGPQGISARPVFDLARGIKLRRPFTFGAEGLDARPGCQPSAFSLVGQ
jgi:hypothetical protein